MNDTLQHALFYGFAIMILLVIVVYFAGLSTDLGSASDAIRSLILAVTGRDSSGKFADYPGNAPQTAAA